MGKVVGTGCLPLAKQFQWIFPSEEELPPILSASIAADGNRGKGWRFFGGHTLGTDRQRVCRQVGILKIRHFSIPA